jgi:hypothetical protein
MRWHRRFVAQKGNFTHPRGPGRPGITRHSSEWVVRMAQDNPKWGHTASRERWAISVTRWVAGPLPTC